jgi:hypothetical protein
MSAPDGWTWQPPVRDIVRSLQWVLVLTALFVGVYASANWYSAQRAGAHRLWFDWELRIPFVPQMVWIYLSIFASFCLPVFALRGQALDALCRRLAFSVVASGAIFFAVPARLGYTAPPGIAASGAFDLIYLFDLPYNTFPSLHVSWSAIILGSLHAVSAPLLRRLLEAWFALLCLSVLLVHQHHVVDIAGGLLVALAARHVIRADGAWAWQKKGNP